MKTLIHGLRTCAVPPHVADAIREAQSADPKASPADIIAALIAQYEHSLESLRTELEAQGLPPMERQSLSIDRSPGPSGEGEQP